MIRKKLTKPVTIYSRWTNQLTGQVKPLRRVLKNVTWSTETVPTALATGVILTEPTIITVWAKTSGLTYISSHEWLSLPEYELYGYWTVNLTGGLFPIIVPRETDFEFTWGTSAQVSTQEDRFIIGTPGIIGSGNPDAIRCRHIDNNQVTGNEKGAHIVIMGA